MIAVVGGARLDMPSMTAGEAALKARGCPPIFFENRFPPRPLRGAPRCSAALTAASPSVFVRVFSIRRTEAKEMIMGMFQPISVASDRVMAALVSGLEIEFGHGVRSEEHKPELKSLMRNSYAVLCLKKKTSRAI